MGSSAPVDINGDMMYKVLYNLSNLAFLILAIIIIPFYYSYQAIARKLCPLLCSKSKWYEREIMRAEKRVWEVGYKLGYEDGKAGREPMPPPPGDK